MTNGAFFYAVMSVVALSALGAELIEARRSGKRWHIAADTIANLNLAAGNVVLGVAVTAVIVVGYGALSRLRVGDVHSLMPVRVALVIAIVFADFLQYWNHRLSHRLNILWWGHITHHSSSQLNLSTGIRINWLYRSYAWLLYAPMPLLGFTLEEFIISQTVINAYNFFMHTRLNVPFGPLGWLLVTPMSHRLHHSAKPEYFGNYGAALIVWDRMFGTYREIPLGSDEDKLDLAFGIEQNVDTADPLRLNFHYLGELWTTSRAEGRSFLRLLFSTVGNTSRRSTARTASDVSRASWLGVGLMIAVALFVNRSHATLSAGAQACLVITALLVVTAFGVSLERRLAPRALSSSEASESAGARGATRREEPLERDRGKSA